MEAQQATTFLDENTRDRPRDRKMVCVRVTNTRSAHMPFYDGVFIPGPGAWDCWIYEDNVPLALARAETDLGMIKAAQRACTVAIANEVREAAEFHGSTDDVIKLIESKTNEQINEVYKRVSDVTPENWQAHFFRMTGRSVEPLDKVEVVKGKERLEPQTEREIRKAELIANYTRK